MDARQKKHSVYDKTHKGWRGPILHRRDSLEKELQPVPPRPTYSEGTEMTQYQERREDTSRFPSRSTSTRASFSQGLRIGPNYATFPTVTWKSPPRAQHRRQRTSAFEWERRVTEGSLPHNSFQRKELDFLQTSQVEQQYVLKEFDRTQAKSKRMEQMIKEIARMREDNKHLSRQIQHYKANRKRERLRGEQQAVGASTYISTSSAGRLSRRDRTFSCPNGNDQIVVEDMTY